MRGVPLAVYGARPHMGEGSPRKLNQARREEGCNIKLVTQLAQSPNINMNDLGFLAYFKCWVFRERYSTLDAL